MNFNLAIIIPVLNCVQYTKQLVEQIKEYKDCGIIIIDNGSTDGTPAYLGGLKRYNHILTVRNSENRGVAGAWNKGICIARNVLACPHYAVLNNDIILQNDTLDKMIAVLKEPEIAMSTAYNTNDKTQTPADFFYKKPAKDFELTDAPDFSCFMLKKETIDKIGYFDEKFYPAYFEDNDYHYRIRMAGQRAVKISNAFFFHYGSQTTKDGKDIKRLSDSRFLLNQEYYIRKWGGKPGKETYKTPFNK
jgi:GT2 family glycosyltransferase